MAATSLKGGVEGFHRRLLAGVQCIPLAEFAALFAAGEELLERVRGRGDLRFESGAFSNDGPELCVPAGRAEIEIPSLLRGEYSVDPGGFRLLFPMEEFAPKACVTVAIFRKCFSLKEMRATRSELVLDFGFPLVDRRYTF